MDITKITIVLDVNGPDTVFLDTKLPPATWPYNESPTFKTAVARGHAIKWVEAAFGNQYPIEVIDITKRIETLDKLLESHPSD